MQDSVKVLEEFGSRLRVAQRRRPELKLGARIELVDHADRGAAELMQALEVWYLKDANTDAGERAYVWNAISQYCTRLERAYLYLARQFQTYSDGWAEVRDWIPIVVARAIRASSLRLKWQLMRYLPIEKDIWQSLARLWSFVEDKGMEQARVEVYEDKSTLAREFLRPMMLAVSAADSLPAVEVDIAFRVIEHFADRFELQRHPSKACNFFVDIDRWTPPERYTSVAVVRSGTRFFGAGRVMKQIDELIPKIAAGEIMPKDMNLETVDDMGAVIHVFEHLGRHWWERRPERLTERRRSLSQIGVVYGFDEIMRRVSSEDVADSLRPAAETWSVENESDGGYGAVLPMGQGEWLHVGRFIALKPVDTRIWAIGIVRRLGAQEDGTRHIGIQLLARGARPVELRRRTDAQKSWQALLLPAYSGGDASLGEINLLLPVGTFLPDSSLQMEVYSISYVLEPRVLLEHSQEFEMARYRIVQRV
ncbi:MAG: hypothetical protein ACJ8G2_16040 [Burkholderiales bacterium]